MPQKNKRCTRKKGEGELEKAATISTTWSTGTRSAADTTGSRELWTCVLTSVGSLNCKPLVPCAFNSRRQLSLTAIGRFGALPHSGWSSLCGRWPQFIQFQHIEQPHYNNNIISFISWCSSLSSPINSIVIHNYALIKSESDSLLVILDWWYLTQCVSTGYMGSAC